MRSTLLAWNRKRLAWVLVLFFIVLAVPTGILIYQAFSQLKWEAFHHYRTQAEELVARIDQQYQKMIEAESARTFTDYSFLNVADGITGNRLQRSPLSDFPVKSTIPGTIGYFQIDNQGRFSTPILPDPSQGKRGYGIRRNEMKQRTAVHDQIYQVLSDNRLIEAPKKQLANLKKAQEIRKKELDALKAEQESAAAPSTVLRDRGLPEAAQLAPSDAYESTAADEKASSSWQSDTSAQAAFDKLNTQSKTDAGEKSKPLPRSLGRVEDIQLEKKFRSKVGKEEKYKQKLAESKVKQSKRVLRKETNVLPRESFGAVEESQAKPNGKDSPVTIFESEIDAFEFSVLNSGHFVLYRKVWRDKQRYIQGLLIEPKAFIDEVIASAFNKTSVAQTSNLAVAYQGYVLSAISGKSYRQLVSKAEELRGTLLLHDRLSSTLSDMELIFSINRLPAGPGGIVVTWLAILLPLILLGGFWVMYRLGCRQITLAQQQQDFVSAVSHELKTPLTSIRMYGEMLREGWAEEDKKRSYYDYIYDESERLTRLINNVLQLARMTRNDLQVDMQGYPVSQLIDTIKSKISSQVEHAGFELMLDCDSVAADKTILVDADYFSQILINLVDNAIKFSRKSKQKRIEIRCRLLHDNRFQISVRDYGPGIARENMRKIFNLFYRSENELTRETVGTGIGLALVSQLILLMHGKIDVVNCEPGVEFQVSFPVES